MFKNVFISILLMLIFLTGTVSAMDIQASLIPDDVSLLVAGENIRELWDQYGKFIKSRIAIPTELFTLADDDRIALVGLLIDEWNQTDTVETVMYDGVFGIIAGDYDIDEVVSYFDAQYNTSVVQSGDYYTATNPYYLSSIVFDVFEDDGNTYLIIAFSADLIDRYYDSVKLDESKAKNATQIKKVFTDAGDSAALAYVDGDFIDRSQESAGEMADMFAFGGMALSSIIEDYALITSTGYLTAFISDLDIPTEMEVAIYPETGTVKNNIFETTRNSSIYHFPDDPVAYAEVNLEPEFIFGVLKTMGFTQQMGMADTQIKQYQTMLSGHFAAAVYSDQTAVQQIIQEMPAFIGLVGISDYNTAYVLLNMMLPATIVTVGGHSVMKVQTQSLDSAFYFYLRTSALIVASDKELLADYFANVDGDFTPLKDDIASSGTASQVVTVYSPDGDVLTQSINQLLQMFYFGLPPIELEGVYLHMDIPTDKKSLQYYLKVE